MTPKALTLILLSTLITACAPDITLMDAERRSIIYIGQPATDVYNNFGTPTGLEKYSDTEYAIIYKSQKIDSYDANRMVRYCDMTIQMKDNKVIDYKAVGNACVVNIQEGTRYSTQYTQEQPQTIVPTRVRTQDSGTFVHRVPQDAFNSDYGVYATQIEQPKVQKTTTQPIDTRTRLIQEEFGY